MKQNLTNSYKFVQEKSKIWTRGATPAGDCSQGLPKNGRNTGTPATPEQVPALQRGHSSARDGHAHDGWRWSGKLKTTEQEEGLAEVTIKEAPERTETKREFCWSAGHTKESRNLFNCLNKQIRKQICAPWGIPAGLTCCNKYSSFWGVVRKDINNFRNKRYSEVSVVHLMGVRKGKGAGLSHRETQLKTRKTRKNKGEAEWPERRGPEKEKESHG